MWTLIFAVLGAASQSGAAARSDWRPPAADILGICDAWHASAEAGRFAAERSGWLLQESRTLSVLSRPNSPSYWFRRPDGEHDPKQGGALLRLDETGYPSVRQSSCEFTLLGRSGPTATAEADGALAAAGYQGPAGPFDAEVRRTYWSKVERGVLIVGRVLEKHDEDALGQSWSTNFESEAMAPMTQKLPLTKAR